MLVCGAEIRIDGKLVRIARLEGDKYHFPDDPAAIIDGVRKSGVRADLFTFLQRLPETTPKFSYPMEWDNFAVLPVSTFDHWWNHQIRSYPRNRARQAEKKGMTLRVVPFDDQLVRGIWEIYNESPVRQGKRFPHYGKDLRTVYEEEATFPDTSIFIGGFVDEKLVGFAKLVTDETGTQANLMNLLSMMRHRDKAPTNALIAHAVRCCAERGIRYLVYQKFSYGKKQADSLSHFKEINGFERVDIPRYYVPLTSLGSIALRLRLHHRLSERLPEKVATKLRELRTSWYNRKLEAIPDTN
jgi:hypothetical protein